MKSKLCPRCGEYAPLTDPFNRGIGAISRYDNKSAICSDCGVEEAMLQFMHGEVLPISEWPINKEERNA